MLIQWCCCREALAAATESGVPCTDIMALSLHTKLKGHTQNGC